MHLVPRFSRVKGTGPIGWLPLWVNPTCIHGYPWDLPKTDYWFLGDPLHSVVSYYSRNICHGALKTKDLNVILDFWGKAPDPHTGEGLGALLLGSHPLPYKALAPHPCARGSRYSAVGNWLKLWGVSCYAILFLINYIWHAIIGPVSQRRYPPNRKYITYRNTARRRPSHGHS